MSRDEEGYSARANGSPSEMRAVLGWADGFMSSISDAAQGALEHGVQRLEEAQAAAVERGKHAVTTADDYVHEHPWKAVGIAAAAGLVVGLWMARR